MIVYILIYESSFGDKIEGIFAVEKDAKDSLAEHPSSAQCRIEICRVINF